MFSLSKYINTVRLKNPIKGQIIIMSTFFLKKWFCTFIFGGSIGHVQSIHYQITPSNIKPSIWPLKQLFSSLLEDLFNMKVSYLDWRWLKSRCCYTDTTCHPVPWLQEKKKISKPTMVLGMLGKPQSEEGTDSPIILWTLSPIALLFAFPHSHKFWSLPSPTQLHHNFCRTCTNLQPGLWPTFVTWIKTYSAQTQLPIHFSDLQFSPWSDRCFLGLFPVLLPYTEDHLPQASFLVSWAANNMQKTQWPGFIKVPKHCEQGPEKIPSSSVVLRWLSHAIELF